MARTFYVRPEQISGTTVTLDGGDARHLHLVLRVKEGDPVIVRTYDRRVLNTVYQKGDSSRVHLNIISEEKLDIEEAVPSGLILSVPRPQVIASIVPKLTELGVRFLLPIITERSFIKDPKRFNVKRFKKISLESTKQCGRPEAMNIYDPVTFKDWVKPDQEDFYGYQGWQKIFPWENESDKITNDASQSAGTVVFIGPEGGLSHEEAGAIIERGFSPTRLTPTILKVETAALYALIKYSGI